MTAALEVRNLTRRFGGVTAVDDVSFTVEAGEIFGLIGPNGAGKTTLFNLVTGITRPTSGGYRHRGTDITGARPHQVARRGIARTFQNIRLFAELTELRHQADHARQLARALAHLLVDLLAQEPQVPLA